jgi:endogenous inhibitor of DNA gyrase (YacG/DUF329 family)
LKVELVCDNCGKTYYKNDYNIRQGRQFCSKKCKDDYNKNNLIGITCGTCGKTFYVPPSEKK